MSTILLTLAHRGESTLIRLEPDPDRTQRALSHGCGHAMSYAGELRAGPLRDVVLALGARFAALGDAPAPAEEVILRMTEQLERVAPDARLERRAPVPGRQRLPFWPSTLRTGEPSPLRGKLWPFDPELAGMDLGARRVIKRECFDVESAARDRAWLEGRGLRVRAVAGADADGRSVLFAARDERELGTELEAAELAIRRAGDRDAAARLGRALGYPDCCIERFVSLGTQDDLSLVGALLPEPPAAPASPLSQWLSQPLALFSHAPCGLGCAATIALARAVLEVLDARAPGFADAWEALARRVHVIDADGRSLALDVEGRLELGATVRRADELRVPRGLDPSDVVASVPSLVGRRIALDASGTLGDDAPLRSLAIADHRAPR